MEGVRRVSGREVGVAEKAVRLRLSRGVGVGVDDFDRHAFADVAEAAPCDIAATETQSAKDTKSHEGNSVFSVIEEEFGMTRHWWV